MAQTNLSIKQKQTHRHRQQTCGCQGKVGEGEGWAGSLRLISRTSKFRMDKPQGPTLWHKELYLIWDKP